MDTIFANGIRCGLLAALLMPGSLAGQAEWAERAQAQFERAGESFREDGYELVGSIRSGTLPAHQDEDQWFELEAGQDYALVGVCDADCSDVDLELFDASGREVYSDLETDDVPVVFVTTGEAGRYRASVGMVDCSVEPCYYGIAVYARAAREPSEYEALVRNQLEHFSSGMVEEGYQRTHGHRIGGLDQGKTEEFLIRLKAGTTYGIAGFCDGDCTDLDLAVLGSESEPVAQDVETDDHPAVDIDVTKSGLFRIRVSMPGCSQDPCIYGVAVFGKPTGMQ